MQNADGSYSRTPFPGNVIPASRINPVANARQALLAERRPLRRFAGGQIRHRDVQARPDLERQGPVLGDVRILRLDGARGAVLRQGPGREPCRPRRRRALPHGPRPGHQQHDHPQRDHRRPRALRLHELRRRLRARGLRPRHPRVRPAYVSAVPQQKFPYFVIGSYGTDYNGRTFGDRAPQDTTYYSWDVNASMSKLWGKHTVKFGASYRKIGLKNTSFGQSSGAFSFDGQFTSAESAEPHELQPVCAGVLPARLPVERLHGRGHPERLLHRLLRGVHPGRLPGQLQPDGQPRPALRVRAGTAGEERRLHGRLRPRPALARPGPRRPAAAGWAHVFRGRRVSDAPERSLEDAVRAARGLRLVAQPEDGAARWLRPVLGALPVRVPGRDQPGRTRLHPDHRLRGEHQRRLEPVLDLHPHQPLPERLPGSPAAAPTAS